MSEGNTMRRSFVAVVSRRHIAAAFTVALVAAAFAAQSSPARTTSAATGSTATTKVVSKKYGYTAVLPGKWFVHYAVVPWLGGFPYGESPDEDFIFDSRDRKFKVMAMPVSAGTTLEDWTASHVDTMETFVIADKPVCHKARAFRTTTLGGEPAREFQFACLLYDVNVVTAVYQGRGYAFQFVSPTRNTAASDRRTFAAGRRAFHFTPK
jgi:hypothetical protein